MRNEKLFKKLNTILDILIISLPLIFLIFYLGKNNAFDLDNINIFNQTWVAYFGQLSPFGQSLTSLLERILNLNNLNSNCNGYLVAIGIMDYSFIIFMLLLIKELFMLPFTLVNNLRK